MNVRRIHRKSRPAVCLLYIMDYNRVVKNLNGYTEEEFLTKVQEIFDVEKTVSSPYHPAGNTHGRGTSVMSVRNIDSIHPGKACAHCLNRFLLTDHPEPVGNAVDRQAGDAVSGGI